MRQTNRSLGAHARACFSGPAMLSVILALFLLAVLLSACNTTVGAGGRTGSTRVGGSVGSTGSMVGIGTSIGPNPIVVSYGDRLFSGPSAVRVNHQSGVKALQNSDYDTAAAIFEETLKAYPTHSDATYYLGLTRIYQGQREIGFALLKSYREPDHYRMTTDVQRMAEFLEKKEDVPAKTVHQTLNRYRIDGYNRDLRETRDMNVWH